MDDLLKINEVEKVKFDLPDADITLYSNFFTKDESDKLYTILLKSIQWKHEQIKFFGNLVGLPRLTAWYGGMGLTYTYSKIQMNPNFWTEELLFIKNRIEKLAHITFSSCLLNLYRSGQDGVNWHCDNERELGQNPVIGSFSLGETRQFQLKHKNQINLEKIDIPLTHGSFLLMKGATQHYWKHRIPKTKRPVNPRINLTFRIIK